MNGPEIHPAVDATKIQAEKNAKAFSEATKRAVAEATAFAEVVKRRRCKRATLALLTRLIVAVAVGIFIITLRKYDHLTAEVAIWAFCSLVCWFTLWVGAWMQFMWGKEGLLK